jgi:hypothetical protein
VVFFATIGGLWLQGKAFGQNKPQNIRSAMADMNSEIEMLLAEGPSAVVLGELEVSQGCQGPVA